MWSMCVCTVDDITRKVSLGVSLSEAHMHGLCGVGCYGVSHVCMSILALRYQLVPQGEWEKIHLHHIPHHAQEPECCTGSRGEGGHTTGVVIAASSLDSHT